MALTYAAPLVGASAVVAGLTPGTTLIALYLDGEERGRSFVPPAAGVAAPPASTTASVIFPQVVSVSQVLDSAGAATGPVKLVLKPGTGDTVNASSVLSLVLDQNVIVSTVSGTF